MTIDQIEKWLNENKLTYPFKLNNHTTILNDSFIESHLTILKNNPKKRVYLSYYERLQQIIHMNNGNK